MRRLMLGSAMLAGILSGCATQPPLDSSVAPLVVSKVDTLPPPDFTDMVDRSNRYQIGPLDKLEIDVFGIEQMTKREIQADAGGNISFPLAGSVPAAGKTPQELALLLAQKLRAAHIRDPQVTVNVKETVSRVFTVEGAVTEPGIYPIVGRMSLIRAVASAKGLTEFAKSEYVVVFRSVKGQRYAALYNLQAIRSGYYDDPEIFANDIVIINESRARRIFKDVLTTAPQLLTPLIYILR
jgi:polysaccharide export outer membrane protein